MYALLENTKVGEHEGDAIHFYLHETLKGVEMELLSGQGR
jgi:hypothetical protein